jgi:hypothetical protein
MTRILVVDDSQTQAGQLIGLLEARGFDAASVPDAEQTLAVFAHGAVDMVISDVVMPGMSGYDFCRTLKTSVGAGHRPDQPQRADGGNPRHPERRRWLSDQALRGRRPGSPAQQDPREQACARQRLGGPVRRRRGPRREVLSWRWRTWSVPTKSCDAAAPNSGPPNRSSRRACANGPRSSSGPMSASKPRSSVLAQKCIWRWNWATDDDPG